MINRIFFFLLLGTLCSCTLDKEKEVDREKFTFTTGDDTKLFFKNMRASDYKVEEKKETRWEIYRHEDLYEDQDSLGLNIAIIINIMQDQAYLYVEPGEKLKDLDPLVIYALDTVSKKSDTISLDIPNREGMLEFASQVYDALRAKKNLKVLLDNEQIPILEDQEKREAFTKTMADYYRLVRIY